MFTRGCFIFFLFFSQLTLFGKVYDCFPIFNELELLRVRLEELDELVDHFVIIEGTKTYAGEEKPLFYLENAQQFEKFKDKIIHVVIDDFPEPTGDIKTDNWNCQIHTRNCKLRGLVDCDDEDLVLICDLDEIPNKRALKQAIDYFAEHKTLESVTGDINQLVCEFHMRLFRYQLNREDPIGWAGGLKLTPYWVVKDIGPWELQILHQTVRNLPKIYDAGCHFSSMGREERVLYRWKCHGEKVSEQDLLRKCEVDEEFLRNAVHTEMAKYKPVEIDETFPQYIRNNLDYFYSIGWIADLK